MADKDPEQPEIEIVPASPEAEIVNQYEQSLVEETLKGEKKKYGRFVLAAMSSIPWVGGVIGGMAALDAEKDQGKINEFQRLWLREHEGRIRELISTIGDILERLDGFGEEVQQRIESPEYLQLVKKTFRAWDQADTEDKKQMLKKLITNAGAITLCPDDLVRLFISWIERYHESHFKVIKEVYQNAPITKGNIWDRIHPEGRPRDDSPEAGLFGYLMRELNMGGIIHLNRQTNAYGQTLRSQRTPSRSSSSDVMESPFEDSKEWVLTPLGKEFVHYVMEDVVPQIEG